MDILDTQICTNACCMRLLIIMCASGVQIESGEIHCSNSSCRAAFLAAV
jgi:hypothetical protein